MYVFFALPFIPLYVFALGNLSCCHLLGVEMSYQLAFKDKIEEFCSSGPWTFNLGYFFNFLHLTHIKHYLGLFESFTLKIPFCK